MKSQENPNPLNTPINVDSTDSEDSQRQQLPFKLYNRDTYQMSPLLFESDTDETSQSTEHKCHQVPDGTPQLATNDRQMLWSTLSNLRNELASPLDTPSQHNRCCSETLLNSSSHRTINETKANTNVNSAYISPSPRVTRSKLWKLRILTRSAKRLHKINELSEYSPISSRKAKTKRDLRKEMRTSSDGKDTSSKASDRGHVDEELIESIRKTKVSVVLERLRFPFFQNPHQVNGNFVQPNIVPNIVVENEEDDDGFNFLNRRPSSEVQMISEQPVIISLSSESTVRNASTTPRASPDLFENFDISSASNLCSQNSIDIPNGQIAMCSGAELMNSATSTPNKQSDSALLPPSIIGLFDEDCVTPDVNTEREKLILTDNDTKPQATFEITVNEVFDNVICLTDSEETLTPQMVNRAQPPSDSQMNVVKYASSQETTPKRSSTLNRSANASSSFGRSKWLSKPRSSDGNDTARRTSQRRLDRSFIDESKSRGTTKTGYVGRNRFSNILLTSSEDDDN